MVCCGVAMEHATQPSLAGGGVVLEVWWCSVCRREVSRECGQLELL